jgi:tyrosyl-tRNA synthetase
MYHSEKEAQKAQENFEKVFQKKELPKEVPIHNTPKTTHNAVDLLVEANLVKSRSEAKRLITQGGVDIDGFPINSFTSQITVKDGSIIKVGKRKFVKIHLV